MPLPASSEDIIYEPRLSILVVSDNELLRASLGCLLEWMGYRVAGRARDGAEALALWHRQRPDVVLLNLEAGADGNPNIRALRSLRAADERVRAVVLAHNENYESVSKTIQAGALGFVSRNVGIDVLRKCIDAARAGERYLDPGAADCIASLCCGDAPTRRELEVLSALARGFCNKNISRHLGIEVCTVKSHVKSLLRKLGAASRTEAALIGVRQGLVQL